MENVRVRLAALFPAGKTNVVSPMGVAERVETVYKREGEVYAREMGERGEPEKRD
jgi:hypothetical protein